MPFINTNYGTKLLTIVGMTVTQILVELQEKEGTIYVPN
jgi:hypothetical protein